MERQEKRQLDPNQFSAINRTGTCRVRARVWLWAGLGGAAEFVHAEAQKGPPLIILVRTDRTLECITRFPNAAPCTKILFVPPPPGSIISVVATIPTY